MPNIPDLHVHLEYYSGHPVISIERGRIATLKIKTREAATLADQLIDALEKAEQDNS